MLTISRRTIAPSLGAVTIRESSAMVEVVEDWSRVRSPSRALRRHRQGHLQNVRSYMRPRPGLVEVSGVLYGHPVEVAKFRAAIRARGEQLSRQMDHELMNALFAPAR